MSSTDQLLLIRRHDFFKQLSDEDYNSLRILHNFKTARRNEYIYFESNLNRNLFFVKEGYVKIGYHDREGNEVIKEIIGAGDIFGQITLEEKPGEGEFAQAYKADVSICAFTIPDFQKLLQTRPELALKYSKMVGAKLRQIENRLVNLLNRDVRTRLLNFLWQLVQHSLPADGGPVCIPNYLTHEDIAHLIGSSRQTVTTMINELVAEGNLVFNRQEICFPDVNKFQKSANVM
jgi:CRP/FNR family transcriptional regulator